MHGGGGSENTPLMQTIAQVLQGDQLMHTLGKSNSGTKALNVKQTSEPEVTQLGNQDSYFKLNQVDVKAKEPTLLRIFTEAKALTQS